MGGSSRSVVDCSARLELSESISSELSESESRSVSLVDGRGSGADGLHVLHGSNLEGGLHDGGSSVRLILHHRSGGVKLTNKQRGNTTRSKERSV